MRQQLLCLLGLATLAYAGKTSEMSCMLIGGSAAFDLRELTPVKENNAVTYYSSGSLTWSMCTFIKFSGNMTRPTREKDLDMFAYMYYNNTVYPLTTGAPVLPYTDPYFKPNVTDDNGDQVLAGITYRYQSTEVCPFDSAKTFNFTNTVICNNNVTGKGNGNIMKVEGDGTCDPHVYMEHDSGCSMYNFSGFVKFLDNNTWLSGTLLVVLGVLLTFFGRQFFKYIMVSFAAIIGFCIVMYFATLFGWLLQLWSLIIMIILALAVGAGVGYFFWYHDRFTIGLMGVAAGVMVGAALYSLILAITKYDALWLIITLVVSGGVTFGILAFKTKENFLSFCTAFMGGYFFMRGFTFWFGHYPSEMEMFTMMVNGETLQLTWQFWLYFMSFIIVFVIGFIWQIQYYKGHDDATVDGFYHADSAKKNEIQS